MRKKKIHWSDRAEENLQEIKKTILKAMPELLEKTDQELVAQLRQACGWVWADSFDTVHRFSCSGCTRPVLLGFKSSPYRVTGHMYRLAIVGEEPGPGPAQ